MAKWGVFRSETKGEADGIGGSGFLGLSVDTEWEKSVESCKLPQNRV